MDVLTDIYHWSLSVNLLSSIYPNIASTKTLYKDIATIVGNSVALRALPLHTCLLKHVYMSNRQAQREFVYILPTAFTQELFYSLFCDLYKLSYNKQIQDYLCFCRLEFNLFDTASCDWCSLCNGVVQMALDGLQQYENNTENVPNISLDTLDCCIKYLTLALTGRKATFTLKQEDVNKLFKTDEFRTNDIVHRVVKLHKLLEEIELRWCPFSGMVKYYRNTNPNYLVPSMYNVYLAGQILSQHDTIRCFFCALVLNEYVQKGKCLTPCNRLKHIYNRILAVQMGID